MKTLIRSLIVVLAMLVGFSSIAAMPVAQSSNPNRVAGWYLHGANMAWLNWGQDFGGGLDTNRANTKLSQAQASGMHIVRWWLFEGGAGYIGRDGSGAPTTINPAVYTDIDKALTIAASHGISLEFTLFASPGDVSWFANSGQHQAVVNALTPLFQHYANDPRVFDWEVVNEPDFNQGSATHAQIRDLVGRLDTAAHASGPTLVDVDGTGTSTVSGWTGLGADFYSVHCYGSQCSKPSGLDKPVMVGEMNPDFWQGYYDAGFAGAYCWSLSPESTNDKLTCDLGGAASFAANKSDLGPRQGTAPTPTPTLVVTRTPTRTSTPTATPTTGTVVCQVVTQVNGVQRLFTRPASFCTDQ